MWFECCECGAHVHRGSAPSVCPECGVAGAIFMAADPDDLTGGHWDGAGLRADWLGVDIEVPERRRAHPRP